MSKQIIETERLILRTWTQDDAEDLFKYAADPDVGPIAGWPVHKSIEDSKSIIKNVFLNARECYAVCLKSSNKTIGCIELKLNGHTDMTSRDDECELGYWVGKPFWGNGYIPEAAKALIQYGFDELNMTTIWCGYYDGNNKSKRVQEKCGFESYCVDSSVDVPLMHETRVRHRNVLTKSRWQTLSGK